MYKIVMCKQLMPCVHVFACTRHLVSARVEKLQETFSFSFPAHPTILRFLFSAMEAQLVKCATYMQGFYRHRSPIFYFNSKGEFNYQPGQWGKERHYLYYAWGGSASGVLLSSWFLVGASISAVSAGAKSIQLKPKFVKYCHWSACSPHC